MIYSDDRHLIELIEQHYRKTSLFQRPSFSKMVGTKVDEGQMQNIQITDIGCSHTYSVTTTLPLQVT